MFTFPQAVEFLQARITQKLGADAEESPVLLYILMPLGEKNCKRDHMPLRPFGISFVCEYMLKAKQPEGKCIQAQTETYFAAFINFYNVKSWKSKMMRDD